MALLNSASLVVTPNAYKEGTLYSVIPNSTLGDMTVVRATTATRVNSAGLIESVANNVPRLDYSNGTCPSLLVEPQRTNVLTYSEQFATSWINNGATIISNDITAPDGNLTADRLTATGGGFGVVKFSTWTATNKVASCFVKANTSNLFRISNVSGGGGSVTFNLSTQAITATTGFTGSIESFPDGWFRCIAIDTLARSGTFSIGVTAIGESVFVWGAQLEAGSYPTSYIPTTTASVTRNADVISKTGISSLIGQTEGTMFLECMPLNNDLSYRALSISDNTPNNRIQIWLWNNGNIFTYIVSNNNTVYSRFDSVPQNSFSKIALSYKENNFATFINGVKTFQDDSGVLPINLNNIKFSDTNNTANFNSNVKQLQIYKTKLTDEECINLTTI
jgi:hypothetical protein